ncbi:hypothetical protein K438DRAFT_1752449 [Mycena galopus ATCC 62051]|nr:hypothetical protein K438DRAFT_1752449 [Mycena galopus ATCC 62051]
MCIIKDHKDQIRYDHKDQIGSNREHVMEPPVTTRWLLRHAVLVAPQMTPTTPKMSHQTFPGQPPDDVALPNEGGATCYRMPREPPGGYWWLHRMPPFFRTLSPPIHVRISGAGLTHVTISASDLGMLTEEANHPVAVETATSISVQTEVLVDEAIEKEIISLCTSESVREARAYFKDIDLESILCGKPTTPNFKFFWKRKWAFAIAAALMILFSVA